jgi:hypothetical protein
LNNPLPLNLNFSGKIMTNRFLTKSRFKMALECPAKLYFTGKDEFANARSDDAFMQALADGGFQVGELAKLSYPSGIEVTAKGHAEALAQTQSLLQRDEATIFEAAVQYGNLFVRIDVLTKSGNRIELIEVKAKSYSPSDQFTGRNGVIKSSILPYLQDVAFQLFVLRSAFPNYTAEAFLMMVDKSARATVDQLNQRFKIVAGADHRVELAAGTNASTIGAPILAKIAVTDLVQAIIDSPVQFPGGPLPFRDAIASFARAYLDDVPIAPTLGTQCAKCEFRLAVPGPRSAFHRCWKQIAGLSDEDFYEGTVLDLWNFRDKEKLIEQGIYKLRQVQQSDLKFTEGRDHLTRTQRQWMQISGEWPGAGPHYLDHAGLHQAQSGWKYPLHFIDFETSSTAVPFHAGRAPYEQVAFQFSHHMMSEDGTVIHAGQFLDATPGVFPNYALVRELRRQTANDEGTIFRWATHENTVLLHIWRQLEEDSAPPDDKEELQTFILSITTDGERVGERTMVDLCRLAEHYYFHPLTKGSCSIKKVLPAVLHHCRVLRQKYSAPTYGTASGSQSLNFQKWTWWQPLPGTDTPRDPYALLPPVFEGVASDAALDVDSDETLANGGAAMTAYSRLQFEMLSDQERSRLEGALLKYCELDTLAMVMIWESWRAELRNVLN